MKTKIAYAVVLFGLLTTTSCEKKQIANPTSTTEPVTVKDETAMTLKEFADSRSSQIEKDFFANTTVTDNSNDFNVYSASLIGNSHAKVQAQKPIIRFRWAGFNPKGGGCEAPLGICLIFRLDDLDAVGIEVSVAISNGKFVIAFPNNVNSNFGLTHNGFMPILFDLDIPTDVASDLGITTPNPTIKKGIYRANYDDTQNRYTGIALTMN